MSMANCLQACILIQETSIHKFTSSAVPHKELEALFKVRYSTFVRVLGAIAVAASGDLPPSQVRTVLVKLIQQLLYNNPHAAELKLVKFSEYNHKLSQSICVSWKGQPGASSGDSAKRFGEHRIQLNEERKRRASAGDAESPEAHERSPEARSG
eukprot:TRINITY_DN5468_c0_g1_i1.p2 TRINITY_DN5468_c0_g1~~TRINITY_DN5468_c0_g1_i1.p2  ORF type:complete len:154 (+),score=35.93 TRINITY_DN5468_c0_g1_i1:243-704(+)